MGLLEAPNTLTQTVCSTYVPLVCIILAWVSLFQLVLIAWRANTLYNRQLLLALPVKLGNTHQLQPPSLPTLAPTALQVDTVLPLEQHHPRPA